MPGAKATKKWWPAILSVCLSLICNTVCGARIAIVAAGFGSRFSMSARGDNSKPRLERVVVAGEDGEGVSPY